MIKRFFLSKIIIGFFLFLFSSAAGASDLDVVERLIDEGRFEAAADQLDRVRTEMSREEEARYLIFLARVSSDPAEVEAALRRAAYDLGNSEWRDEALFELGEFYLFRQDVVAAAQAFGRLVGDYDESPFCEAGLYWLGTAQLQSGEYEEARDSFWTLVERFPDGKHTLWARVGLGDAFFTEGRYESAVESYREVLVLYPHCDGEPWVQLQIARGLSRLDRIEEATRFYEYLLRTYPSAPESYLARADRPDLSNVAPDPILPAPGTPPTVTAVPRSSSSSLPPVVVPPPPSSQDPIPPVEIEQDEDREWNFAIQVAAFRQEGTAETFVSEMADKGMDCYIVHEGNFYKVRTGRYETIGEARTRVTELKSQGIDCFAVNAP